MKTGVTISIVAVCCFVFNCTQVIKKISEEDLSLGSVLEKHHYKNLSLFPILANSAFLEHRKGTGLYLSLNEAVNQKKVNVREQTVEQSGESTLNQMENGAEVNSLLIENISSDTVLILNGEIVSGGNQDRVIATDIVLPPHSGQIDLDVFCVEQDRWQGEDQVFVVVEKNLSPAKVRQAMKEGQEEVWESVAEQLVENDIHSRGLSINVMYEDKRITQHIEDYLARLKNLFDDESKVVGIIAIANNKIVGCDLFATHDLLVKHYPNLLQSYATEALSAEKENRLTRDFISEYLQAVKIKATKENFLFAKDEAKGKVKAHFSMD